MRKRRRIEERVAMTCMVGAAGLVAASLVWILWTICAKGFPALSFEMLVKTPQGGYYLGKGGGILNAILGSLYLGLGATALAAVVAVPVALYLNVHLRRRSRFAWFVRFFLDVLWGVPSIVYGAFAFAIMAALGLRASLMAGILTVTLLILPIMIRSMDEVLKMVPRELKEAAYALGSTRLETATRVVLRQVVPGLITAILIAFGRGIGDAAAVLFTAGFTDRVPHSLFEPVATLPLAVFFQLGTPFPEVQARGYASAFVLTVIVLAISIVSRVLFARLGKHGVK